MINNKKNNHNRGLLLASQKRLFEMLEHYHFFFEIREKPDFKKKLKWMKKSIEEVVRAEMPVILRDLTVLLQGDDQTPGYAAAFKRYVANYANLSPEQLREYYAFLCRAFEITPAPTTTKIKQHPSYQPSIEITEIIENENPFGAFGDDIPF